MVCGDDGAPDGHENRLVNLSRGDGVNGIGLENWARTLCGQVASAN